MFLMKLMRLILVFVSETFTVPMIECVELYRSGILSPNYKHTQHNTQCVNLVFLFATFEKKIGALGVYSTEKWFHLRF